MITERIDAITKITERYLGTVLPAPRSVKIEITATCNYHCSFCTKSLNNTGDGHMDRADRPRPNEHPCRTQAPRDASALW